LFAIFDEHEEGIENVEAGIVEMMRAAAAVENRRKYTKHLRSLSAYIKK
jgi:hypothetical protein